MTYQQARLKFTIEEIIMLPFVLAGKLYGILFPLKTKHNAFLFFPNADIGGSPKVNIDITNCIKDKHPLIIFSKKPKNNKFKEQFTIDGVRIIDLHKRIDNKLYHFVNFFYRGVIASWINREKNAVVLGGECMFFYKMLPHLRKDIRKIEVCHLPTWLHYTIGHIERITWRIFSTQKLKEEVIKQYDENRIEKKWYDRLLFIDNAIDIPAYEEINNENLEVVFIGRGSPQKRVPLIVAIAKKMHEANDAVHFSFVGDVENVIAISEYPYCKFYGNVNNETLMNKIYNDSDALILTSAFEGLPVVVMMMMAYGRVVVSTAVNGIPDYIRHMENGLLITATEEDKIVDEGIQHLRLLIANSQLKKKLGLHSREIAIEKFSRESFCREYRGLLFE
ncbi:MAG: glycosyltransferase family 4 protein [Chitinophagaceae bacterium]